MKTSILLAFTFVLCVSNAQEFKASEKYVLTNQRSIGQEEESGALIDLVESEDTSKTISTLKISEIELLESVHISVLSDPHLEAVAGILKVELEYSACCSSTETYYFLVTDDNDFISLPSIANLYCDGVEPDTHYIFPSQGHGEEGRILRAKIQYTETYSIKAIEVLQSFVWNDDGFDAEDAITVIEY